MRKLLSLAFITIIILSGCTKDEKNELEFDIWCRCKVSSKFTNSTKNVPCDFFAFPEGNYSKIEILSGDFGTAYALNTSGEKIKNIGYAYYSGDNDNYAILKNYNLNSSTVELKEGTFYIACFPSKIGYRYPYKAKTFTKMKNKELVVEPIFAEEEYYDIDGYQYFEWD